MPLSSSILSDFEKNIYAYSKKKKPKTLLIWHPEIQGY